jgi:hypothetical protein
LSQLEHIEAIEKRLWNAADTLRANSNYASNEYFLPVMGLIFLRLPYIAANYTLGCGGMKIVYNSINAIGSNKGRYVHNLHPYRY